MSDLAEKLNKKYAVLNSECKVKSLESNVDINISNVVCSYSTRCHLNLKKIAMQGMHVEYKRENNMVNMRLRRPLCTATIWSSGKITCTGATTELDAYKAARRFCRLLQKMKFKVRLTNYRVVNVLATCSMPFDIDLNKIANEYKKECSYEPELHPGATFRVKQFKCTLKLFTTGSITLTAPSVLHTQKSIDFIYPILCKCRRQPIVEDVKQDQSYLVTTRLSTVSNASGPTIINLNKTELTQSISYSSTSSSLSNDSFSSTQTEINSFSLNPHYYSNHYKQNFSHFFNDNLIIDHIESFTDIQNF